MMRARQSLLCLAAVLVAAAVQGQTNPPAPAHFVAMSTNLIPLIPVAQSPVVFFRQLLMMSPTDRIKSLAQRTPESRVRILAKVREYLALDPDDRELRLRATELRWYLVPLLRLTPAERSPRLAQIPPELLGLVQSRLTQWDALSPELQTEFLSNTDALHYFTQTSAASSGDPHSQQIEQRISQFFDLTEAEKTKLLGVLSKPEREQMEKTLQTFARLPVQQRAQCLRNYAKFAGMSTAERTDFLKNAETWAKLSPQERQTWRDLVAHVPMWPPMPLPIIHVPTHVPAKISQASIATN